MTEAGAGLLPRPRLLSLLAESPARMVLLKAPPGFGKTALLQSYAAQRREAVVWVNCQQADNDPMCLANNLGRALLQQRLISPQALERQFNGFGIPSPELITDALLTLLQQPAPLTLVFNDIDQLLSPPQYQPGCPAAGRVPATGAVLLQLQALATIAAFHLSAGSAHAADRAGGIGVHHRRSAATAAATCRIQRRYGAVAADSATDPGLAGGVGLSRQPCA